jgi:hypothetical protein
MNVVLCGLGAFVIMSIMSVVEPLATAVAIPLSVALIAMEYRHRRPR